MYLWMWTLWNKIYLIKNSFMKWGLKVGFQLMQMLGLLGMYFDAVSIEVEKSLLFFFRLALAILWLHKTCHPNFYRPSIDISIKIYQFVCLKQGGTGMPKANLDACNCLNSKWRNFACANKWFFGVTTAEFDFTCDLIKALAPLGLASHYPNTAYLIGRPWLSVHIHTQLGILPSLANSARRC